MEKGTPVKLNFFPYFEGVVVEIQPGLSVGDMHTAARYKARWVTGEVSGWLSKYDLKDLTNQTPKKVEMKKSYLIQRLDLPGASDAANIFSGTAVSSGIVVKGGLFDSSMFNILSKHLFSAHYMGTAQLETGVVAKTFAYIGDHIGEYKVYTIEVETNRGNTAPIYVIAKEEQIQEMARRIKAWAKGLDTDRPSDLDTCDPIGMETAIDGKIWFGYRFLFSPWWRSKCSWLRAFKMKRMITVIEAERAQGWMDVSNMLLFFRDKTMFERFCKIYGLNSAAAYWGRLICSDDVNKLKQVNTLRTYIANEG